MTETSKRNFLSASICFVFCALAFGSADTRNSPSLPRSNGSSGSGLSGEIPDSKRSALAGIDLDVKWYKAGFGNVMEATFTVQNNSDYTVKDIEITCTHFAASGTRIDSNTRTIYEVFKGHNTRKIPRFNMGFIHDQAQSTSCKVTDLTVVGMNGGDERASVVEIQKLLGSLGYAVGAADGVAGPSTTRAIREFQKKAGMPIDGLPSGQLLATLRARAPRN